MGPMAGLPVTWGCMSHRFHKLPRLPHSGNGPGQAFLRHAHSLDPASGPRWRTTTSRNSPLERFFGITSVNPARSTA